MMKRRRKKEWLFFLCSWAKPFLGTLWKLLCRWCVIGGAWGDWDVTGFLKAVSHWERQRKVSERERVLACSAFENFYNLQFSCNLQEHIFQQKNSRSLISTTLQSTLPFFFLLSICALLLPLGLSWASFFFFLFLLRYAFAKRESEKTDRNSLGCAVFGSVLS